MAGFKISGLASGLDTEKIIGDIMRANRIPLDRLKQDKQLIEWKRDGYREMNLLLREFDNFIFDGIGRQSSFVKKTVTSSNSDAVTAVNINGVSNINTTIRVDQLAEAAYMNSAASIRVDSSFNPSGKLVDQRSNLVNDFTSNTFTIQAINSDGTLGKEVSFTIDPENDSLNGIIYRINNSTAGVTAFYDEHTGKFSLIANNTGNVSGEAEIKVSGDFLTSSLGLADDNIIAEAQGNGKEGLNAKFNFNGLDTERNFNTFRINGYEYTLRGVTDNGDQVTGPGELVTLSSKTDTGEIYDTIVSFVNKYNEIIEALNGKTSEERFRDFQPLSEEQKKEMTEREIELWEKKAQSGMLRNDSILKNVLSSLRIDLYSPVSGLGTAFTQLAQIGITTSSSYADKGKLIINESKLKEAINQDPMAVYQLFNQEVKDGNGKLISEESGLVKRMRQTISNTMINIEAKAGNSIKNNSQYALGRELNTLEDKIDRVTDSLKNLENRYWKQFTMVEKLMAQFNSQFGMLSSVLNTNQQQK